MLTRRSLVAGASGLALAPMPALAQRTPPAWAR
jgi:hypothetical protein